MTINGVQFWDRPSLRIYQVFDANNLGLGAWSGRGLEQALCALAQHPDGYMVSSDEYRGRGLRWLGHFIRFVVSVQPGAARTAPIPGSTIGG